jgi:excisionase family DNA binding protein
MTPKRREPAAAPSPWLKREEAAAYLRVDASTLDRWRRERNLPAHQVPGGGGYRYHREELDRWLKVNPEA